jgi:hypothetical protein
LGRLAPVDGAPLARMAGHPARGAGAAVKKAHPVQLGFFHWVAIVQVGNFLCLASQPFRSHINIPADAPKPFNRRIPRKLFPGKNFVSYE